MRPREAETARGEAFYAVVGVVLKLFTLSTSISLPGRDSSDLSEDAF